MLHRYNTREKSWIRVLRILTGQCTAISSRIADTTEAAEPQIMVLTRATGRQQARDIETEQHMHEGDARNQKPPDNQEGAQMKGKDITTQMKR